MEKREGPRRGSFSLAEPSIAAVAGKASAIMVVATTSRRLHNVGHIGLGWKTMCDDTGPTFRILPWIAITFWVCFAVHGLVSASLHGWFTHHQGSTLEIIRFLIPSLSYVAIGAGFHIACKVQNPSIIHGRLKGGVMVADIFGMVRKIVMETMVAAFLLWICVAALLIGSELRWR